MGELLVQDKRHAAIEAAPALNPMQELQMQIVRSGDIEKLKELRAIEKEWREDQARQAFNAAFSAFKAEAVKLARTKEITDGPLKGKKHVELGEIVRVTTPALSKHGLSISWKLTRDEPAWMEVTCILRHELGHSEAVSMGAAPDGGPGRNAIQARGSAKTYLERYTATAILGLAPEDGDDDGNGGAKPIAEDKLVQMLDWIKAARDEAELTRYYLAALKKAKEAKDKNSEAEILKAKNERWSELHPAPKAGAR